MGLGVQLESHRYPRYLLIFVFTLTNCKLGSRTPAGESNPTSLASTPSVYELPLIPEVTVDLLVQVPIPKIPSPSPQMPTVSISQHTMTLELQSYRSKNQDQLFAYQGDLNKLGTTVEDVAKAMKPFDHVILTNIFGSFKRGSTYHRSWENLESSQPTVAASYEPPIILNNGTCVSSPYRDKNGKGGRELIDLLRAQNPGVKIYGYVSATSDLNSGSDGCWSNAAAHQNYLCPGGVCADFVRYVEKWREIEFSAGNRRLDGFFIDLFNEFYASRITLANQTSYIKSLSNKVGQRYQIIANTTATSGTYFFSKPENQLTLGENPIDLAGKLLQTRDVIAVEGLFLKGGKIPNDNLSTLNRLVTTYNEKGIYWMGIASEIAYIAPSSGQTCRSVYGTISGGMTAQESGCADSVDYAYLEAPTICELGNFRWVYQAFRAWANLGGGIAFTYSDAGLGSFTGKVPFCPHDKVQ